MALATVERLGGKLVIALSVAGEQELDLVEGLQLQVERTGDGVRVGPRKYNLNDLLAQCDYSLPMDDEEREWLDAPRVGRELI